MATRTVPPINTSKSVDKREEQKGHAGFLEYTGVALDSLRANKLRSFLTLLGIIIGITSIIVVICIIQGLDQYWKQKVSNFGPNSFVITQFGIITDPDKYFEALRRNPEIHIEEAEAIRRVCTACEEIGVEVHKDLSVRYKGQTIEQVDMSGITPSIIDIEPYDIENGRNLLEWEDDHAQFVAFIGWELSDKLFGTTDPINKQIYMGDHWFTVVGVAEKRGSVFGFSRDNFAKIPLSTFQKIYGSRRSANISIKGKPGQMQLAEDQARRAMRTRHRLAYNAEDDFGLLTSEGVNQLFDKLTSTIFAVSLFVVGVSLVVGGIVIMNIMLVSVLERTREIGVRKAVGARQQDVVNQFLVESVVLCSVGGLIGVLIAYGLSWLIGEFSPLPSVFPLWAPVLAFVLSTVIGVFFGIFPARRAGGLDPIEALRAE
jgi:putative ABC transport system permease protein